MARAAVRKACRALTDADLRGEAELLTSELVTNAVTHGEGLITVAVECETDAVAVAVGDASPTRPQAQEPRADAAHGRGLRIVEALAGAWGVRATVHSAAAKFVWFSLP